MALYFKNNKKIIVMTKKDEEVFENNNISRFCENNIESAKVRNHCHMTGNYRRPAHSK